MGPNQYLMLFLFLLVVGSASATYISKHAMEPSGPTGRNLLNAKSPYRRCPINFDAQNYRIITSQCKGPNYNQKLCCDAFKKFSCPFADQINDLTNDCAINMFRSINLYYPPGLFADICIEGSEGLECPS